LLKLVLYNNDFEFDGEFYLQICGIAMGRKFALSAANIYLRHFDHKATTTNSINPIPYFRFLRRYLWGPTGYYPTTFRIPELFQQSYSRN